MSVFTHPSNDDEDMGTFRVRDWKDLREVLRAASDRDTNWHVAATWFCKRLQKRYLEPIGDIPTHSNGPGFTIVTVLCGLIEHLAALEEGKIWGDRGSQSPYRPFDYYKSADFYIPFLERAWIFDGYFFCQDGGQAPFSASDFYSVRCALAHEACTKNSWRINTIACGYWNPKRELIVREGNGIKRIYRDLLVTRMEEYIEDWLQRINTERQLQYGLARKLDSLCGIEPDLDRGIDYYKWWQIPE